MRPRQADTLSAMPARAKPALPPFRAGPLDLRAALTVESLGRLRGPAYQRLARGVYWRADGCATHGQWIEAFRSVLGPEAVLAGRSAAWVLGAQLAGPQDPVEIVLPASGLARSRPGLRVRCDALLPGETVASRFGATEVPVTSPARTAFDLARVRPPGPALAWVDAVLRATGIPAERVSRVAERHPGVRGVRQARMLIAVADGRAESPRESLLRWLLVQARLPPPVPQYVILDAKGVFVARLDLAWPAMMVAAEYDGDHHRDRDRHSRDLRRHNRLRALGWQVVQVDAAQLRHPEELIAQLRHLLAG